MQLLKEKLNVQLKQQHNYRQPETAQTLIKKLSTKKKNIYLILKMNQSVPDKKLIMVMQQEPNNIKIIYKDKQIILKQFKLLMKLTLQLNIYKQEQVSCN